MKILYLLQQFPKMSSETFILNEMIELQRMGHDVWVLADIINHVEEADSHALITENNFMAKVVTGEVYERGRHKLADFFKKVSDDLLTHPRQTGRNLYFILLNNPYYKAKNIWSKLDNYLILRKLPRIKFDLVYSPFAHLEKIDKGMAIANIVGVPFVTAFRALELYGHKCQKEMDQYKKIFAKIASVVTISEFNKRQLEKIFGPARKISVVHSSIDPERFKPMIKKELKDKVRIITIARFVEKKGIIYLLEALAILKKEGKQFTYTLIGEGPLREVYDQKIAELGISDRIKILAPIRQELVRAELECSDILVLPCVVAADGDRDIIANVLKEAMAMEIPVITSDISGIGELIINRENGLLVPERDASALAAAICELIDDANLRERLAKAGRKKIISDFNVKIEAKKLSLVLSETVMRKTKIQEIKTRCDGMMPREVYAQIYSCACAAQPGNMLELGAAHGAASVCLAKGIRDSAKPATLLTVEKGEGKNSSIEKWGPKEVNIAKLRNNLIYFDCQSIVTVFPNRLKEVVTQLKNSGPFSLLLIDADGFIDRDFLLFYNLLKPGADIIIDDYINFKDVASKSQSNPLGKGYATYIFVNYFLDKKLIRKDKIIEGTIFCKKPEEIIEPVKFDEDELIRIRTEILAEAKRILSPS